MLDQGRLVGRLWRRLVVEDDCWIWQGAANDHGYGQLAVDGKTTYVHRLMYELCVGLVPAGTELDHLCRRPLCCNPAHLEPVTHRENVLRGSSQTAVLARSGRCARGHALDGVNLYVARTGRRHCLTCKRIRRRISQGVPEMRAIEMDRGGRYGE